MVRYVCRLSLRCQKKFASPIHKPYDYLIFHVKNNVKLLEWISFLKMIPHVSFPDKNLRNFSLSLREQKPGRRHDNDNEKFHQKSQLPKNFSLKILSSEFRLNNKTTLEFFLNKWLHTLAPIWFPHWPA